MANKQVRSLSTVQDGETVKQLASVEAGRGLNSRLATMGFVANVEITVVNNNHPRAFYHRC